MKVVAEKGKEWMANHEVHSARVEGPWPNGDKFIVRFSYDVTNKPSGRRFQLDEAALFTVAGDKIVREEFFYASSRRAQTAPSRGHEDGAPRLLPGALLTDEGPYVSKSLRELPDEHLPAATAERDGVARGCRDLASIAGQPHLFRRIVRRQPGQRVEHTSSLRDTRRDRARGSPRAEIHRWKRVSHLS